MKARESGMPEEKQWDTFFNPKQILKKMGVSKKINDVVDFGCGYGTFALPAAKLISGKVYAIDIEPEMIKITRKKAKADNVKNVVAVLRDFVSKGTGLEGNSVDYAMLFNILHAKNPEKLLNEAYRILQKKGRLGIIHWNYDSNTPRGPPMKIRPKPADCIKWAELAGFKLTKKINLQPYHYGIMMSKISIRRNKK